MLPGPVHRLAQLGEIREDSLLGALARDLRRLHQRAALLARELRVVGAQGGEDAVEELGVGVVAVGAGPGEGGRGGDGRGGGGGGRRSAGGVVAGLSTSDADAARAGASCSSLAHAAGSLPEGGVGARGPPDAPLLLGGRARGVEQIVEAKRKSASAPSVSLAFAAAAAVLALVLFLLLLLHALKVELVLDCFFCREWRVVLFVEKRR